MTLRISKRSHSLRYVGIISGWTIGIGASLAAPLSQAVIVTSPSTSMDARKNTSPQNIATLNTTGSTSVLSSKKPSVSRSVTQSTNTTTTLRNANCTSSRPMHTGLASSSSSQLRKLSQYEAICTSSVAESMSFFVGMPTTLSEASDYARDVVSQLKEFARHGITPLVFMEPTHNGALVSLQNYRAGAYDTAVDSYFATIKAAGVSDAMMGTWVPLPEGNIPVWSSIDPSDFSASVTKTVQFQKKHFPNSQAAILLDNQTYPSATSWSGGQALSLKPYIQGIQPGLIDSVGLQGFPWSPAANEAGPTNGEPTNYLQISLLAEAARYMGISNVWVNTGTFGTKYAGSASKQITVSPEQRQALLTSVVNQLTTLQRQGFRVSAHLFAENKSSVPETTDWSYWPNGRPGSNNSTAVLKGFVNDLRNHAIPLWIFDTDEG